MKRYIVLICFLFLCRASKAQILNPVHWSYAAKKLNKNEAVVFLKAVIDPGWHIYSVYQKDGGPVKTSFEFDPSKDYELTGNIAEPAPLARFEPAFGIQVSYFEKVVVFQQKLALKGSGDAIIVSGKLRFMVCNDHQCLPPETVNFKISL